MLQLLGGLQIRDGVPGRSRGRFSLLCSPANCTAPHHHLVATQQNIIFYFANRQSVPTPFGEPGHLTKKNHLQVGFRHKVGEAFFPFPCEE